VSQEDTRRRHAASARGSLLHVTNGDSAAGTLRQTSLGGEVLAWRDALHEGPVPAGPRGLLLRRRAEFLSGSGWGSSDAILSSLEQRDQRLRQALPDWEQVVLWFEHDLYDQLQLVDVLALTSNAGGAPELIVVGSFPGKPSFRGLGELTADELETLWPARTAASREMLDVAVGVWVALRHPDPRALAEYANAEIPQLPFLASALRRLLAELPAPHDGLSETERLALQAISAGATSPTAAFQASQELEAAPFLGDTWFFRTLAGLGSGESRLIETQAGAPLGPPPPLGDGQAFVSQRLRLTAAGERVLAGKADRIELLGADRWVGGTHITAGTVWRWAPATHVLTRPADPAVGGGAAR
jgi:uncharacterized protein DUF1835